MGSHTLEVDFHKLFRVCVRKVVGLQVRHIFFTWELEVILFFLVSPFLFLLSVVTRTAFFFFGLS